MPPMQLRTLVLPAPLGPMSAKSSAGSTANETASSTTRPPKQSPRPSTSSSAIPSPGSPVLLDVPIAASPPGAGLTQVELLHVGVSAQARAVAVEHDAAVLHHIAVVGDVEGHGRRLLHDQDGGCQLLADLQQALAQICDDHRREA